MSKTQKELADLRRTLGLSQMRDALTVQEDDVVVFESPDVRRQPKIVIAKMIEVKQ